MATFSEEEHDNMLSHIGIKRRSGRYPWGSGKGSGSVEGRAAGFSKYVDEMTAQGMSHKQIAEALTAFTGVKHTSSDIRDGIAISTEYIRAQNTAMAERLAGRGFSNRAIAERMGLGVSGESTVRGWLKAGNEIREGSLRATAGKLKEELVSKPFLDVGKGTHLYMGITATKLNRALAMLRDEGYNVFPFLRPQLGVPGQMTRFKVLTTSEKTWEQARQALDQGRLSTIAAQSDDGGVTFKTAAATPVSISSKKIAVRYGEDGGGQMDGVIELRRDVPELSLGASRYGQVRIAVDGTHYLKGMAMYADDLPDGVDIRFNTPKSRTGNKLDVMKTMEVDKDGNPDLANPFGSSTYPRTYTDKKGRTQTSPLNIVGNKNDGGNLEGRWDQWSRSLSSQMLSKQPLALASKQLGEARTKKQAEFDKIMALTNPVVKKQLLDEFAESADSDAVHLKAAAMPRQMTSVILPMNKVRPTEIYAPGFNNGERVALVRHPHAGPFEIPELTVNNKNLSAKRILGNATDAVGIHHSVADKLSGADFDGDAVLVIPNDKGQIKSRPALKGLEGFDPKTEYKIPDGDTTIPRMTKNNTQTEMGKISNLITDMSLQKATDVEMAQAVRHSMVVIDAEKHGLNYKLSERDNSIANLKTKYQGGANRGAATLISKSSAELRLPQQRLRRKAEGGPVNPKTGELQFIPTGRTYTTKTGEVTPSITKTTKMRNARDARELLSGEGPLSERGLPMERTYAMHANAMKDLANKARIESLALQKQMPRVSPTAKAVYKNEVDSLNRKLAIAQRNAPLERRAQTLAKSMAKSTIDARAGLLDADDIKKIRFQALNDAREMTGAAKIKVYIEDREWRAIQAGAVAHTRLKEILSNSDMDRVKTLATPHTRYAMTPGQTARARQMAASGKPMSEIAEALGIPRSTIIDNLGGD